MTESLGFMLPAAAAAIAFSLPEIMVMILLIEPGKEQGNALGFAGGLVASCLVVSGVFLLAADALNLDFSDERSNWVAALLLILGVGLLYAGFRTVVTRPRADEPDRVSAISKATENLTATRAMVMGAVMGGFNPTFLAVIGSLTAELTLTDASRAEKSLVMVVFTLIASAGVLGPLIAVRFGGDRAQRPLEQVRAFLDAQTWLILTVVLWYFGVKLIGDSLRALT